MKANLFFLLPLTLLCLGCASIVSKSTYPVSINTTPSEAKVEIKNRDGVVLYNGPTPANLYLDAKAGYFRKGRYSLAITKEGFEPLHMVIEAKVDGWYFGNFLFGGLIGLLIVDPATGAMYKLPETNYHFSLPESAKASAEGFQIITIDEMPEQAQKSLIRIN